MVKIRAARKLVAEINVVPYIDVMLVLLVVFMITAPMLTQGVAVDLPKTSSGPLASDDEPVIVSVSKDGQYFINVGEEQQQSRDLDTVRGHALRIMNHTPETAFLVEADQDVPYGRVMTLMSVLQGAGIDKLGLVTEPPEQAP